MSSNGFEVCREHKGIHCDAAAQICWKCLKVPRNRWRKFVDLIDSDLAHEERSHRSCERERLHDPHWSVKLAMILFVIAFVVGPPILGTWLRSR